MIALILECVAILIVEGAQKRGDISFFCPVVMALTLFVYINNCKLCVGEISEIHVPNQYSVHVISILFNET